MQTHEADSKLKEITSLLKAKFRPTRLFLYGSRANGTHRPDSDFDFVVVVPQFDRSKRYKVMAETAAELEDSLGVEVQVWVYSQSEFEDWKDEFSSIPETAMNTGKEIELG